MFWNYLTFNYISFKSWYKYSGLRFFYFQFFLCGLCAVYLHKPGFSGLKNIFFSHSKSEQFLNKIPFLYSFEPNLMLGWFRFVVWIIGDFLMSPLYTSMYRSMDINVSSVVEFQRRWVLEIKIFGQESTYSKEIVVFYEYNELRFVKKCQNCTFKVDFLCQKPTEFFWVFFSLRNINLGNHFL